MNQPTRRSMLRHSMLLALAPRAAKADTRFALDRIDDGILLHEPRPALTSRSNRGDIANLAVVIGEASAAVIDTGGSPAVGRDFLGAIRRITDRPVRYVVNTHAHPDHIFGNVAFESPVVTFAGHVNLPRTLSERQEFYMQSYRHQLGEELLQNLKFVSPTLLVEDEMSLDLGSRKLLLKAWPPAHTNCDLTVMDEATGTLFTGDLVFRNHVPVLDGTILGWMQVLKNLARVNARRAVPGHGPVDNDWPVSLRPQLRYLEQLVSDLRVDIRKGTGMADAARNAAASERASWQLFDEYNARNVAQAFRELEWE